MSKVFKPVEQPNDKATLDFLKSQGITFDAQGNPVGNPFQGQDAPSQVPVVDDGTEGELPAPVKDPFDRLEDDDLNPEPLPGDLPAEDEGDATGDTDPKAKGLEKREADAREAQRQLGKMEARLKAENLALDQKLADIDQKLQQMAALQATVGVLPDDLDPASAEVLADWKENQTEAVQVMQAIVAPLYKMVSSLREQTQGITQRLGEYFAKTRREEVEKGIYAVVPKAKVDALMQDPTFLDWMGARPPVKRRMYVDVLQNTSNYTPEDALEILREFSRDANVDLGLNGGTAPAAPRRMPTSPSLRSGGALPEPSREPQRPPSERLTPLSQAELDPDYVREKLAGGDPTYLKRLELTLPGTDFSAWHSGKTF
jgi:hypothetical protein